MTFNDLKGQNHIVYDAYAPNMIMHAKNQVNSRGADKKAFFGKAMLSPSKIMLTSPQSMKRCIKVIWVADSCCY